MGKEKKHDLAFIVSSSLDKPDANARQAIRSHVMRGKNRRKRASDFPSSRSWINQETSQHPQLDSAAVPAPYFPLPMQMGSDLALTHTIAYDMQPYELDLVFKFFTVVGQQMYPIELCLVYDLKDSIWFEYLADPLCCHSILWTTQAYFDWLRGFGCSYVQTQHAHETLVLLQQRLNDTRQAISDITIGAVVSLVMMTAFVGDHKSSKKHMMGLYRMVELRGGVKTLAGNTQVQLKVCRADLTIAMFTDSKPRFFRDNIPWGPYIAKGQKTSVESLPRHFAGLDMKLSNIWADLREFTKSANLAFQTGQKMDGVLFQEILIFIQYRLLHHDVSTCSQNKAIHLGMLAFSTNVFVQMQGLAIRFERLSAQLRDSALGLQGLEDDSMLNFKLWLLLVARMSIVAGARDSWLKPELKKTLEALGLASWTSVRDRLKGYLWIGVLHDNGGKKAFADEIASPSEICKS